jgi:hypothetical protein
MVSMNSMSTLAVMIAIATVAVPQPRGLGGITFTREVMPFAVAAPDGREHALPFLGGLDVPRPQFVDIDGDTDLDLFVQEYSNALMFFENTGAASAPRYEWRSDRYQNLEIGEWYRFVDLDGDGRIDLLSELPFSHIRHYRNTGTAAKAQFTLVGPLRDDQDAPLFLDRQNIPAIVDLDCDGRLDLFVGRVEGTVTRYEAEQPKSVRFSFIEDHWEGIEIIGTIGGGFGMGTARHGANALAFADFDGDGDLDLFWGDFFEPGVLLIENIGRTCSTPSFDVQPVLLPGAASIRTSGYNAPAPVDLDADGDLDFLMGVLGGAFNPVGTSADNFFHWERTGDAAFTLKTKRLLDGVDLGSETSIAAVDLDADGDLDLVVGSKIDPVKGDSGRLTVFHNDGTANAPRFRQGESLPFNNAYHLAPAFGDLDADGDPDMLLGTWNQDILYYVNEGSAKTPRWTLDEARTIRPPRASHATPALGDLDGDGDLDLVLGQASGTLTLFRNTGSRTSPRFELGPNVLEGIRPGRRTAPTLVDIDGDGRLDLVVGRESAEGAVAYRQTGPANAPRFEEDAAFTLPLPSLATPRFADLDGDGVVDLASGTASGGIVFYRGRR